MFNADLLLDLARKKVVLFLGAGVSASAVTANGGKIAGWDSFLRKTTLKIEEPIRAQVLSLIEKKDFLLACEILQITLAEEWEKVVSAEFGQIAHPSNLHKAILSLKQRIVITTNFDKVLEAAWSQEKQAGTHYAKIISALDKDVFRMLKDFDSKYLLKIHGSIDDPSSLVFSRSEYIKLAFGNESYSGFLETLLLNFTFLFIGFSMDDPAITSLLELYALKFARARPHYIFTPGIVPQNIVEINKRLRKLSIIQYDASDDHAALPPLIYSLSREARERQRELISWSMRDIEQPE